MTIALRDVAHKCWATGPAVLSRIACTLLVMDPEFGNCRRAGPGDPPPDLTLPLDLRPVSRRFVQGWTAFTVRAALIMGKGKHSRPNVLQWLTRHQPNLGVRATSAWVDLRTGITHLLTPDAVALCGAQVIPAMKSGQGDCQPCHAAVIPAQRSR